jgi:hypothetical protein
VSKRKRRQRHESALLRIARLEYELGLTDVPPPRRYGPRTPADAARAWQEAASAKAANYSEGFQAPLVPADSEDRSVRGRTL